MGRAIFPPCCLTSSQIMVEVMKLMVTSFKRSHAFTAAFGAPDPAIDYRQPKPPPETPGHSQASLGQSLVGSLILSSGSRCTQGFVCALQESVSPVLCKFWWHYGGVNGDLFPEDLCHARVCCTQSPCGRPLLTHTSTGDTQIQLWQRLCGVSGSWCAQGLSEPSEHLWWVWGLILNMILPLLSSFWGFSFALGCRVSFFGGIQHSPVNGCSAANRNFGVLEGCLIKIWGDQLYLHCYMEQGHASATVTICTEMTPPPAHHHFSTALQQFPVAMHVVPPREAS